MTDSRPIVQTSGVFVLAALLILMLPGEARAARPQVYAVEGARILVAPGETLDEGTLVIRDGLIEAVGRNVEIPPDAEVIDGRGKTLHAGFIDGCSRIALPQESPAGGRGRGAGARPSGGESGGEAGAFHPVERIRPERRILDKLRPSAKVMASHREMGFTSALVVPDSGIFRGTSALITTGDGGVPGLVMRADVAQHVAFERGRFRQPYPTSLMGAIAAIRQGLDDARRHEIWQARYEADPSGLRRPEASSAWGHLADVASGRRQVAFDVNSAQDVLRALAITREYGLDTLIIGSGQEHEIAGALKEAGVPVILPLSYPEKPGLDDEDAALEVSTVTLRRFLDARANASRLAEEGIPFAFGTCRMKLSSKFHENLRAAIKEGLDPEAALGALTTTPARLLGVSRAAGTLEAGKAAHVVLRRGDPFSEETQVERVWVDGRSYTVEPKKAKGDPDAVVDPRGTWVVSFTFFGRSVERTWTIAGEEGGWTGTGETGQGEVGFDSVELKGNAMTVTYTAGDAGSVTIEVIVTGDDLKGTGETPGGRSFELEGVRKEGPPEGGGGGLTAPHHAAAEGGAR